FYIIQLIPISLFANLLSIVQKTHMTFFQNAKIALLASMGPFILIAILSAFQIQVAYQYEITLFSSLFLFYISITKMKKRIDKQKKPIKSFKKETGTPKHVGFSSLLTFIHRLKLNLSSNKLLSIFSILFSFLTILLFV